MKLSDLTIIVPTRNEAHNIPFFIQSIPDEVTLIVVDSSDDNTADLACRLRRGKTIVYSCQERIAAARDLGAHLASTEWLLFTDADVNFSPDYFLSLASLPLADVYFGAKSSRDKFIKYYSNIIKWQSIAQYLHIPAVSGSNFLLRRRDYFASGGFDLDLLVNEDSELGWRLARLGYKTQFVPELIVYAHDHRRLERGTFLKTSHSLLRCGLLYLNLIPRRWRSSDWGYWQA